MQGKFIAYIADFGAYYLTQKLLHIKAFAVKAFAPLAAFIAASGFLSARIKNQRKATASLTGRETLSG